MIGNSKGKQAIFEFRTEARFLWRVSYTRSMLDVSMSLNNFTRFSQFPDVAAYDIAGWYHDVH